MDLDEWIARRFHDCLEPMEIRIAMFTKFGRHTKRQKALGKFRSAMICIGNLMTKDRVSFLTDKVFSKDSISYSDDRERWRYLPSIYKKVSGEFEASIKFPENCVLD